MRIINTASGMTTLLLGRLGENERTQFVFNVEDWLEEYPDATIAMYNQLPHSEESYPVVISQPENGKVTWTVADSELQTEGYGRCELVAVEGETVVKGHIWKTRILESLDGAGEVPDPWESWMTEFTQLKGAAEDAAEAAEDAKESIEGMSVEATTLPAGSDATVTKTVDPVTGAVTMSFGLPKGRPGTPGYEAIDDAAGLGDTDKAWSADKLSKEFAKDRNNANISGSLKVGTYNTTVQDANTVAFGRYSTAVGTNSLASGNDTNARGSASQAFGAGSKTEDDASASAVFGAGNIAKGAYQLVFGRYNAVDNGTPDSVGRRNYIEIVGNGNGTSSRLNARTLDWQGNERLRGNLYVEANVDGSGGTQVAKITDIPDLAIDDTAGTGDTDVTWSADKITGELADKYEKPASGIPATDLASGVIPTVHNVPAGGTTGQVLTKTSGTDYATEWTTPQVATDAQVAQAVDDWLDENVAQETGYVLDRTLLLSNAAAPADLVGDLKNELNEYENIFTADVDESVQNWLDAHPEATTTVQDRSITTEKLASDVLAKFNSEYIELDEIDGDENTVKLNEALAENNVILKSGMEYPINPGVIVDGHTLDLNGSTLISNKTKQSGGYILLMGESPKIKNGKVAGNFTVGPGDSGYSSYYDEIGVQVQLGAYSKASIEDVEFSNVIGYAVAPGQENETYCKKYNVYEADLDSTTTNDNTKEYKYKHSIEALYDYVTARHGIGYNYRISEDPVKYAFYDSNDTLIYTVSEVPGVAIKIPSGSSYVVASTWGYKSADFVPYVLCFYKYDCTLTIERCYFHHNAGLAIANLGGIATVDNCISRRNGYVRDNTATYTNDTTGFIDIEDVQTGKLTVTRCKSLDESVGISSYAYELNVSDCDTSNSVDINGGFTALIQNTRTKNIKTSEKSTILATNCTIKGAINTQILHKERFKAVNFFFDGCLPRVPELYPYFVADVSKVGLAQTYMKGSDKPIKGLIYTCNYRLDWQSDGVNTNKNIPKGSDLTIINLTNYASGSTTYAYEAQGQVYGLKATNLFVFPSSIYDVNDSEFNVGLSFQLSSWGTNVSRKYKNCVFDLSENMILVGFGEYTVNVDFENCVFRNSSNYIFQTKAGYTVVTATFTNCTFADSDKIHTGAGTANITIN